VLRFPSLNITTASPALSFAFIVNIASPFSSVTCLLGDTSTISGLYTLFLNYLRLYEKERGAYLSA
jgi:hypothetical protein